MKKFTDEFDVKVDMPSTPSSDYEAFPNKVLLDELRNKIIQRLIDANIEKASMDEFVIREIDTVINGYDLSSTERSYIYNLIENEISGYGPITDLLEDRDITEIMVNGIDEIFIEVDGQVIQDSSVSFINELLLWMQDLKMVLESILS